MEVPVHEAFSIAIGILRESSFSQGQQRIALLTDLNQLMNTPLDLL